MHTPLGTPVVNTSEMIFLLRHPVFHPHGSSTLKPESEREVMYPRAARECLRALLHTHWLARSKSYGGIHDDDGPLWV